MKKLSLILMSIFALGLITSCSSSNDENVTTGPDLVTGTKTLTINITGAHAMAGRNIGSFSTEEGTPLLVGGNEATINNLIVIVYDNVNNKFEPANKFVNPDATGGTITEKVYFKTTQPSVFVVANVPLNALDGVVGQNMAAFKAATASLNVTSITGDASGTSQVPTNLPMVGSTTTLTKVTSTVETDFAANITLYRMVSRIALTKFTTDFKGAAGRSFTVTDVFLKNVNTTSSFLHEQIAADAAKATMNGSPTVGASHDGFLVPSNDPSARNPSVASYLLSSYASGWNGEEPAYFYVFPNTASAFANKTQLVIKGQYVSSTGSTPVERYYVCVVNAVPDGENVTYAPGSTSDAGSGSIAANRKYSLEIKVTDGSDGTQEPLTPDDVATDVDPNPLGQNNVVLTISVADWAADIVQNVTY